MQLHSFEQLCTFDDIGPVLSAESEILNSVLLVCYQITAICFPSSQHHTVLCCELALEVFLLVLVVYR